MNEKELKSLQEVCALSGVSRRTVQGYEKAGLVSPVKRNKYGYLLYGESELQRIMQIRQYQRFDFSIKEIKNLIDAPVWIRRESLERKVVELKAKYDELVNIIRTAEQLIQTLENKCEEKMK